MSGQFGGSAEGSPYRKGAPNDFDRIREDIGRLAKVVERRDDETGQRIDELTKHIAAALAEVKEPTNREPMWERAFPYVLGAVIVYFTLMGMAWVGVSFARWVAVTTAAEPSNPVQVVEV